MSRLTTFERPMSAGLESADARTLLAALLALRQEVQVESQRAFAHWRPFIARRSFRLSALNLAAYLALRRRDMRALQTALMPWGLSSLGRSEARVLANLDAVLSTLGALCGADPATLPRRPPLHVFFRGERLLQRAAEALLGPAPAHRQTRIMVTLPTEAASQYEFVYELVRRGMDCARINCAHDTPAAWGAMAGHVRRAAAELGRPCIVLMDLGGPKVRTGPVVMPEDGRRLVAGETLLLTRALPVPESPTPFQAVCLAPEVLDQIAIGDAVWIDDGKLGARVEERLAQGVVLRVVQAPPKGFRLRPEKGLNFPDSALRLSPLTEKDRQDLEVVAAQADAVGYSFVQEAADIELLQRELWTRRPAGGPPLAIVAKIETSRAVRNLPDLIVRAAGRQPFGVMIARGDLAVEIGYQRLAEIQEELLWVCEAAHVPVIWATQVLENLVRKGTPSRAEVTDAAMAVRAECVMLNKGPFLKAAVSTLNDVLTRMQDHQHKKTPQLRALKMWPGHSD